VIAHSNLAVFARRELAAMEQHWPAAIEAGQPPYPEAAADLAAWRVITALFETGEARTDLTFAALEATARRIHARREAVHAATPESDPRAPSRNERRAGCELILRRLADPRGRLPIRLAEVIAHKEAA
jgi:hypothetical protein